MPRSRRVSKEEFGDLFSLDPSAWLLQNLDRRSWPDEGEFPVNRAGRRVRDTVWPDLVHSPAPLLVVGYSSLSEIVRFLAEWDAKDHDGQVRLLLGTEPFSSSGRSFRSPRDEFTAEVEQYWLHRGISLHLSGQVIRAIAALDRGAVRARFVHGATRLHAKIYVGDEGASLGSSNFTPSGLRDQVEANVRFRRRIESDRYDGLAAIGENYWSVGEPWDDELRHLLESLLRIVTWQEALARACAELLEGGWAVDYLSDARLSDSQLWPSQRAGIAQALWIIENVGSVLVADATGSGKTKMGANLVRAVRDRLWSTGRVRRGLTVLVAPPAVKATWQREAVACGLSIDAVSQGVLSRDDADEGAGREAVHRAQVLAVDEAHNFLNASSKRTRWLRGNLADHVLLFTATPISKGTRDLLDLVGLLGPDNFEDETLEVLGRLERRRRGADMLAPAEAEQLRGEIQRFTLRRTKSQLNELVDRDPDGYLNRETGRVCRYPHHDVQTYDTGETHDDEKAAAAIRTATASLQGIARLEEEISLPAPLRHLYSEDQWLHFRLAATKGLAAHQAMNALRSSRAALLEHLEGTQVAVQTFGVEPGFKPKATGNVFAQLEQRLGKGPPRLSLRCETPEWLRDPDNWAAACREEITTYRRIRDALEGMSDAREQRKITLLEELALEHDRVLAFDNHLITLAVLRSLLHERHPRVFLATGASEQERKRLIKAFAPTATARAIALCSDAMNEGLNLQGASAMVHLDLPTTLRVAEQRVGRVDRMDSPYDHIQAWWPRDGDAFATRANERLARRVQESAVLLGANLQVPDLTSEGVNDDAVIQVEEHIQEFDVSMHRTWDGIQDALEPVRQLALGIRALMPLATYEHYRTSASRVLARVAPVRSDHAWAFFAVAAAGRGAPRWLLLEGSSPPGQLTATDEIAARLRELLSNEPPSLPLDDEASVLLDHFLEHGRRNEQDLLPRRMQRALAQMRAVVADWADTERREGNESIGDRWRRIAQICSDYGDEAAPDPYLIAERWLELVAPILDAYRSERRGQRYILLREITSRLIAQPLEINLVEQALSGMPTARPFAERVTACILGVATS